MMVVFLFTKSDCNLCEDVQIILRRLQAQLPFQLEEIDITTNDATFSTYRHRIPVVQFGRVELSAPIDSRILEQALRTEFATH